MLSNNLQNLKRYGLSQYFLTNKNTNIFGLTKKSEYKYQYIQFEEEKNANTNANIFELTKEDKYEKNIRIFGLIFANGGGQLKI